MIPALLLVCGGLLFSLFGISMVNDTLNFGLLLFHPAVILGGMALALLVNLLSVLRVRWEDGALIGVLNLRGKAWNLSIITLIVGMVGIIFL